MGNYDVISPVDEALYRRRRRLLLVAAVAALLLLCLWYVVR